MNQRTEHFTQELFESEALHSVCGNVARPGGFLLTSRAVELCGLKAGARVLDVGCGAGASVEYLSAQYGLDAVGIDPSREMLKKAFTRNPKLNVQIGRAERLAFEAYSMDAVLCECSLSRLSGLDVAVREIRRVLKKGGWVMASDLYIRQAQKDAQTDAPRGLMEKEEILARFASFGFSGVVFEDHSDLLAQMTMDIIMEFGSLERFFITAGAQSGCDYTSSGIKLGYYLLIARKGA